MKKEVLYVLLILLSCFTTLSGQAWEEIYYENFGTGYSGQPLPANWAENIFNGTTLGATGGEDDPCRSSLLRFYSAYLAYQMDLSATYEYYASMNLKTDDPAGMEIAFYHNPTAAASGTVINSPVVVPIIASNQPGQVVSSAIFNGLNGTHYFIIAKGPNDPSDGDHRLRVDDFRLYRRPVGGINAPPSVSITAPADGAAYLENAAIAITATASDSDGSIQSVKFYHGTTLISEDTTVPYEATLGSGLTAGSYTLKAEATDDQGSTAVDEISITITANAPPSITITAPADGAAYLENAAIAITATASDSDGSIQSVKFYQGTTLISEDTTAPYEATLGSGLAAGSYTLKAEATDNQDSTAVDEISITITATNLPPSITITAPADGATYLENTAIAITATASDSDGSIQSVKFYQGTTLISEDTTAPYEAALGSGLAAGSYTLKAEATDNQDSTAVDEISITITANALPSITITAPADGATYLENTAIAITATASDSDGSIQSVKFYQGTTLISEDTTAPYEVTLAGGLAVGSYTLKAVATDDDGDSSESQININVQGAPPSDWELIYYENFGTGYSGQPLPVDWVEDTFNGTTLGATGGTDDPCRSSLLRIYSAFLAYKMDLSATYEYYVSMNLKTDDPAGMEIAFYHNPTAAASGTVINSPVVVPIIASNQPGQVVSSSIFNGLNGTHYFIIAKGPNDPSDGDHRLRVDDFKLYRRPVGGTNTPPTVNITAPADGASYLENEAITITATASDSDGSLQSVKFYHGATLISEDTSAPYEATLGSGLAAGSYTLKAEATDNQDSTAVDEISITITVTNLPPAITITAPADGASYLENEAITITATASDSDGSIQSVKFLTDASLISEDFSAPYQATISGGLAVGIYNLKAIATDDDGDTNESQITITVEASNTAPLITINTPSNGAIFEEGDPISFQAVASDADGVIQQIDLYEGANLLYSVNPTSAPYAASYVLNGLLAGSYNLKAVAIDDDGLIAEKTHTIAVGPINPPLQFQQIPTTSLGKGDLVFIGFDNDIDNDKDRIIVTNLVDILPGTRFMITNANYCEVDNRWRSLDSLDGYIPIQSIRYEGAETLPIGSVICFDIPAQGDYLISDFMINGSSTDAFIVQNIGQRAIPDINLRKDSTSGHLFLLQGGNWRFDIDSGTYTGRMVAPPIRYGSNWDDSDCSTGSQLPGASECIAGPNFPTIGGSVYAYFDCSQYGSQYSPFAFLKEAIDPSKWDIQSGTDTLDLAETACGIDCAIIQDSIYWVFAPDTLILDCVESYQDSILQWLANNGNATASSSCQEEVSITYHYPDLNPAICLAGGQPITFIATDSCGGRISAQGVIQVNMSSPLSFEQTAQDTTIQCDDPAGILNVLENWIAQRGGATVSSNCLVDWSVALQQSSSPCGLIDSVLATFHAISICGDTISTSAVFEVEDNIAPIFSTLPRDTIISCNDLQFTKQLDQWLKSAGHATISDNCTFSSLLEISHDFGAFDGQCGSNLVTFTLSDLCGNTSTATATITIEDTAAPVITSIPISHSILINDTAFQTSIYQWLEEELPLQTSVTDLCTIHSDSLIWNHDYSGQLAPGQCDSTIVNLSIADKCGNTLDTNIIIYAIDPYPPYFATRPDTLSLTCDDPFFETNLQTWKSNTGNATVTDVVPSGWTISHTAIDSVKQRCGYYRVQFTVTDGCGNSSSSIGIVQVTDDTPPYFTGGGIKPLYLPYGGTNNLATINEWLTGDQVLRAQDDCTNEITWQTSYIIVPDTSCVEIPVVFFINDGCHTVTDTSFIHIYNPSLDTLSTGDNLQIAACEEGGTAIDQWLDNQAGISIFTNCGEEISFESIIGSGGGENCSTQNVTFSGITPWGDTLKFIKEIELQDNQDPFFNPAPSNFTVNCSDSNAEQLVANWLGSYGHAQGADDCPGSLNWYRNYNEIALTCGSTTVTFTIEDACGNTAQASATLTIEDNQAPSIVTPASSLDIYLTPSDLTAGSSNERIENLIASWLQNNGNASALDTSFCQQQNVGGANSVLNCAAYVSEFPYTESFENGPGLWSEQVSTSIWLNDSGGTPSTATGPSAAIDGTYYMYTEASSNTDKTAILQGPCFALTDALSANFLFQYHMYGSAVGSLRLEASTDGQNWVSLWSKTGLQGNQWRSADISLANYAGQLVSLRFYATTGSTFSSDMALDKLQLIINENPNPGPANNLNLSWSHDFPSGSYAPTNCENTLVTFTVADACGNTISTQASINIIDTINIPILDIVPQSLDIPCDTTGFEAIVSNWLNNYGNAHAYDPQGGEISWSHNHNKPIVPICLEGTVTFTATNSCGNSTSHTVIITIRDETAPQITTNAGQIYINSGWPLGTQQAAVSSWLATNGQAQAVDNCINNLEWSNNLSINIYDSLCASVPITFTVSDGCDNETSTIGTIIMYQSGFIVHTAGEDLDLICCAIDTDMLNNWLNNQANAQITTNCGEELSWTYSGYNANATENCSDQTITFTGTTPYGETHSFSKQIHFYASACCEQTSVSLNLVGSPGNEVVQASTSTCPSPLYSWYINGKPIPDYTDVTSASIPYGLYGPGHYSVSVDCEGYICEVTDTLELCSDFTLSLACSDQIIYHSTDHQCQANLKRYWYRDEELIAFGGDFVPFDAFGTYKLLAFCDSSCYTQATLTLSCEDINLGIIETSDELQVQLSGCFPSTISISWFVDGNEISEFAENWSIPKKNGLGTLSGLYEVKVTLVDNSCIKTASIDICDEQSITILNNGDVLTAASKFQCYTDAIPEWYLEDGGGSSFMGSGISYTPAIDGTYVVYWGCDNDCSVSASFDWVSPCTEMEIEAVFLNDNFSLIDAQVSGAERCQQLLYSWVKRAIATNTLDTVSYESPYPYYSPTGTGYYSVFVRCVGVGGDCYAASSNEVFYTAGTGCNYGVNIIRTGNELCAVVTGDACNAGNFVYTWTYNGGQLVGPFGDCITIPSNNTEPYLYTVTVECGGYCEAYAEYQVIPCDLGVYIQATNGDLCASITGTSCVGESPTYIWRRYGNIVQSGTADCYTPLSGGQYSVEVICGVDPSCEATSSILNYNYVNNCAINLTINEDGNGQLCGVVSGVSCEGETIAYSWTKNNVVYSTASCFTPSTNGFYKLTVTCGDGQDLCENEQYYSYQVPCDLSVNLSKNQEELCASISGSSCNNQLKTYKWYLDGVLLTDQGSCIIPSSTGNYTVEVSCGDCNALKDYPITICELLGLKLVALEGQSCGVSYPSDCAVLQAENFNFCNPPLSSIAAVNNIGQVYDFNPATNQFYVKQIGCYRLTTSNNCSGGSGCPSISTEYCFSSNGSTSLIRTDQPPKLALETVSSFSKLNIYPNPTQDEVNIALHVDKAQAMQLTFYDANGKAVLSDQVGLEEGQNQLQYRTHDLPEGVYIIRLQTPDELLYRKLMVIRK
ncbi:MAG: Ig-like domain-containing protein [Saprospiraceae bacterium]